jgi:hypothetical protein
MILENQVNGASRKAKILAFPEFPPPFIDGE